MAELLAEYDGTQQLGPMPDEKEIEVNLFLFYLINNLYTQQMIIQQQQQKTLQMRQTKEAEREEGEN